MLLYIDLVNQCLDANRENRPSCKELYKIITNWRNKIIYNNDSEFSIEVAAESRAQETFCLHSQISSHLYKSLLLFFKFT